MTKIRVIMGSTYCGCPSDEFEFEYDGTKHEFEVDTDINTEILNMILNGEFPHYFLDFEFIDEEKDD